MRVSGTLSRHTTYSRDGKRTIAVIAKVCNGKQRIYFQETTKRSTQPSEEEMGRRCKFAICSKASAELRKRFNIGGNDPKVRRLIYKACGLEYDEHYRLIENVTTERVVEGIILRADLVEGDRPEVALQRLQRFVEVLQSKNE